jgi:hypothetical protein
MVTVSWTPIELAPQISLLFPNGRGRLRESIHIVLVCQLFCSFLIASKLGPKPETTVQG